MAEEVQDVKQALNLLFKAGETFEVCGIGVPGKPKAVSAGWFRSHDKAVAAVMPKNFLGTYVTLNPVNAALLARSNEKLTEGISRTKDAEITIIRHLLIDVDVDRPQGISSSDDEHESALLLIASIRATLSAEGWPDPLIVGDSGNGGHLIYLLDDLPNIPENVTLLKQDLAALALRFNTGQLKVDQAVFNPARLVKLYGTMARKGEDIEDRRHRISKILETTQDAVAVPGELLDALAREVPTITPVSRSNGNGSRDKLDVEEYLGKYGVEIKTVKTHGDSTLYVLKNCVFDETHKGGEASIGQTAEGKLFYQCFHDSCQGRTWKEARELISGAEPVQHKQAKEQSEKPRELNPISVHDLLEMEFPARENVLSPWLPSQGSGMIHAMRGIGKTHCSLGIAYAVASGGTFLKWTAPEPRGVLLLDGEMPAIVLQERLSAIIVSADKAPPAILNILTPDLQKHGMPGP